MAMMAMIPAFTFVLVLIGFLLSPIQMQLVNSLTVYLRQNCQPSNSFWFSWPCSLRCLDYPFLPFLHLCISSSSSSGAPAFKFVLTFIALLLSQLLKAVRMPIGNASLSVLSGLLEAVALNEDDGWAPR
jgi:hypothetical protein